MTNSHDVIRHIAWRELFPWLILFRTFWIAISPTLLAIATAAVLIAPCGWWIGERVFLTTEERDLMHVVHIVPPRDENSELRQLTPADARVFFPFTRTAVLEAYFTLSEPLKRFFRLDITLGQAAYYAFGFLWTLAVWAFPGGVVTRRAVVQLATDEPLGIRPALTYACRRYLWYVLAPLYPLVGVLLLAAPIALVGLVLRLSVGFGALVAGLGWLVVVIASVAAMWLLGGLLFGWPLMWPTISAERDGDPFESFSRSYSYVYGKPLHYFFYVVVAAAFGALCWAVVSVAALLVQEFGFWALSWGGGEAVIDVREQALDVAAGDWRWSDQGRLWNTGTLLIGLVVGLVQAMAIAFRYTFFFTVASAIYLLLRHDVDEKEADEVYLEKDGANEGSGPLRASAPVAPVSPTIPPPPAAAGEQP